MHPCVQLARDQSDRHLVRRSRRHSASRCGAILSVELLLVLPLLVALFLAVVEWSLLLSAQQLVQTAAQTACRTGTLPIGELATLEVAVRRAAEQSLVKPELIRASTLSFVPGEDVGDNVIVEIRVPMRAAAPDLLGAFAFSLKGRELVGRSVLRKE